MKRSKAYANVFEAIEDDPGIARNLALRAALMRAIVRHVERSGVTQAEAARRLGVSQPRVSDLVRGRIERFTIDRLVNMAARAGLETRINVRVAA